MWVPAAVLLVGAIMLVAPVRRMLVSESAAAFLLTAVAVLILHHFDRLG